MDYIVARKIHAYDHRKLLAKLEHINLDDVTPDFKIKMLEQLHSMMEYNLEFEDQERIEIQILRLNTVPDEEEEQLEFELK